MNGWLGRGRPKALAAGIPAALSRRINADHEQKAQLQAALTARLEGASADDRPRLIDAFNQEQAAAIAKPPLAHRCMLATRSTVIARACSA